MNRKNTVSKLKAVIGEEQDLIRGIVQIAVQEFLEAEMNECLGAAKSERTEGRLGFRSGHYRSHSTPSRGWHPFREAARTCPSRGCRRPRV
jgi:transposase-like protein